MANRHQITFRKSNTSQALRRDVGRLCAAMGVCARTNTDTLICALLTSPVHLRTKRIVHTSLVMALTNILFIKSQNKERSRGALRKRVRCTQSQTQLTRVLIHYGPRARLAAAGAGASYDAGEGRRV